MTEIGSESQEELPEGSSEPSEDSEPVDPGPTLPVPAAEAGPPQAPPGDPPRGPGEPPDEPPDKPAEELKRMTLLGHLEELRKRILHSLAAVFIGFLGCWFFAKPIYRFLSVPVHEVLPEGERLVYLTLTGPFFLYMKVAALAAVFLTSPFLLFQVWRFVAPGLYRKERFYSVPFIFFGSTFFLGGGVFAYYVAFPFAIEFLIQYGEDFDPAITVGSYFSFLLTVILGLGVMFELPMFIFLFTQMGLVSPRFLIRNFRWAVLIIVITAAIITPTADVINLALFAVPTILLYLLGVGVSALVLWRRKKGKEEDD
jgi:sec-independent protein translocase protein TatC